jgi:hypothetical protein
MAAGLGFKTFNSGDVLSAADVNGYLMQGVLVFASTAARDAAITAPAEGQFAFTKDTNSLFYYDGAAWVASGATGDIEGVTAGTGISGGGTSGTVTITNSMATAIDAKGDLIVGTGADTFSKLSAGTNGYLLTADSAEATGLKWAAAAGGGGKVLQVVSGTYSTSTLVSSSSFTDTGLSLAITPTLTTSKVLVIVSQQVKVSDTGSDAAGAWQLVRGATAIVTVGSSGYEAFEVLAGQYRTVFNYTYLDSPATTSATTYKTQVRRFVASNTVTAQDNSAPSQITLLEIGA